MMDHFQTGISLGDDNLPKWQAVITSQTPARPVDDDEDQDNYFSDDELFN